MTRSLSVRLVCLAALAAAGCPTSGGDGTRDAQPVDTSAAAQDAGPVVADVPGSNLPCAPAVDSTASFCINNYPIIKGYGFESDPRNCVSGPPGSPAPECPPITPESTAEKCAANGHPCNAACIMTRDSAICIAEANGLAKGLEDDYRVQLVYHHGVEGPVWNISNLLEDKGFDGQRGEVISVDAITGAAQKLSWRAIP